MPTTKQPFDKLTLAFWLLGLTGAIGGAALFAYAFLQLEKPVKTLSFPQVGVENSTDYADDNSLSQLTGLPLAEGDSATAPVYCMQTPNGVDGARPQAGLTEAGVIFEAIAEAGITRFAAIYQNPHSAVVGPIRSLRLYYLQWDTPFDCVVVHAGGAENAISALHSGDYVEIDENTTNMYRSTYGNRLWNNLFTTSNLLATATSNLRSAPQGFSHLSPAASERAYIERTAVEPLSIIRPAESDTSEQKAAVSHISLSFNGDLNFDVDYTYDVTTNTYKRSFGSGLEHEVYHCPSEDLGTPNPEQVCEITQLAPNVVIAMVVKEKKASDNYHEDITTLGTGPAYIFQHGTVIEGTWSKASASDQIKFFDADGDSVSLATGQTIVSAIPTYGNVSYR